MQKKFYTTKLVSKCRKIAIIGLSQSMTTVFYYKIEFGKKGNFWYLGWTICQKHNFSIITFLYTILPTLALLYHFDGKEIFLKKKFMKIKTYATENTIFRPHQYVNDFPCTPG